MTDTTGEILHLLRPVEDAERPPRVDSGQHRTTSQAGLASIQAAPADGPGPGKIRVTLDLTPEQVKDLADVLDSGEQAIGDTTDRMEEDAPEHYSEDDLAEQRAYAERAHAVAKIAHDALHAARKAAEL